MRLAVRPSVLCLFCEDIRVEKSEAMTIVGIWPDNVAVPSFPGNLTKISIYARAMFPASKPPGSFSLQLALPWPPGTLEVGQMSADMIATAAKQAREQDNETIGLILWGAIANFQVPASGRIKAVAKIDGRPWHVGSLNIVLAQPAPAEATRVEPATTP